MSRYKAVCAYDGTDFCGWQSQPNGDTVQDIIERRLDAIFKKQIRIYASGRTDSGVHARAQVFHFDANWPHSDRELLRAFGSNMPDSIQISSIKKTSDDFHARFSASSKRYRYYLHSGFADPMSTRYTWSLGRKLDTERMKAAAEILRGEHDFRGFTARRNDGSDETLDPVRNLYRLDVSRKGNKIEIIAEADGFLYKMVRSLVGALVEVGLAKLSTEQVQEILISGKRGNLIQSAPAHGLFLEKVFYEKNTSSNDATISRHIPGNGSAHLDIFIDTGARDLATFEAPNNSWETLSSGNATTVSPKTAHRKRYLNFEGELSDQRGSVAILWKGKWKGIQPSPDEPLTLKMESGRLNVTAAATPSS